MQDDQVTVEADTVDHALTALYALVGWLSHRRMKPTRDPAPTIDFVVQSEQIMNDLIAFGNEAGEITREKMKNFLDSKAALTRRLEYDPPTELELRIRQLIVDLQTMKRQEIGSKTSSPG